MNRRLFIDSLTSSSQINSDLNGRGPRFNPHGRYLFAAGFFVSGSKAAYANVANFVLFVKTPNVTHDTSRWHA